MIFLPNVKDRYLISYRTAQKIESKQIFSPTYLCMTEYVRTAKRTIATKTAAVLTPTTVIILSSSLAACITGKNTYEPH